MSDGEMAWTSFDTVTRQINLNRFQIKIDGSIHPTQKPIKLYKWLLSNYAKKGDIILDTHLGSGSSRIAAYEMDYSFYSCEIDKEYYENSIKRFENFKQQISLFTFSEQVTAEQVKLF